MSASPKLDEVYRPPAGDLEPPAPSTSEALPAFYVVAPTKFVLLFVSTLGMYELYWFYLHFKRSRAAFRLDTWPVARAVFALFFAHRLFRQIDDEGGRFRAGSHASLYVVLTVTSRLIDRFASRANTFGLIDGVGIALGFATIIPLYAAQKAANRACGDPQGIQNSRLTLANWAWCTAGVLVWLVCIAAMVLPD